MPIDHALKPCWQQVLCGSFLNTFRRFYSAERVILSSGLRSIVARARPHWDNRDTLAPRMLLHSKAIITCTRRNRLWFRRCRIRAFRSWNHLFGIPPPTLCSQEAKDVTSLFFLWRRWVG